MKYKRVVVALAGLVLCAVVPRIVLAQEGPCKKCGGIVFDNFASLSEDDDDELKCVSGQTGNKNCSVTTSTCIDPITGEETTCRKCSSSGACPTSGGDFATLEAGSGWLTVNDVTADGSLFAEGVTDNAALLAVMTSAAIRSCDGMILARAADNSGRRRLRIVLV